MKTGFSIYFSLFSLFFTVSIAGAQDMAQTNTADPEVSQIALSNEYAGLIKKPEFPELSGNVDGLEKYLAPLRNAILSSGNDMWFDPSAIIDAGKNVHLYFKLELFKEYSKKPELMYYEMALNIVPSLGSWIYGNNTLALTTDIGLVAGCGLLAMGLTVPSQEVTWGSVFIIGAVYFANIVIFPGVNMQNYNLNLIKALGLPEKLITGKGFSYSLTILQFAF